MLLFLNLGRGVGYLLLPAKGVQRPQFVREGYLRCVGSCEEELLNLHNPSDTGEPGDQKLPLMTEEQQLADQVFSNHSLEPGAVKSHLYP